MNCPFCRGDRKEGRIRYVQEYQGRVVVVENVPAEVCSQCGEALLHPDVAEKVQQIVWGMVPRHKTIEAEAYDFAQVA